MKSDTEIIVVPLRQMLLFEKLYAQNFTESYDVVEAINVDIGESLSGDVIN